MYKTTFARPLFAFMFLGTTALTACGAEDTVDSNGDGVSRAIKELTGDNGIKLVPKAIKGTYGASCKVNKNGTWDLTLNDASDRTLQVALNDTFSGCPLTMTTISVQEGTSSILKDYAVAPPIVLGTGYATAASAVNNGTALAFFTNAKFLGLGGATYANNFTIDMIYSDDSLACGNVAPPAIYAKVSATATGSPVPPANYGMGFDSLQLVVDANRVVQSSSSGNIVLQPPASSPQAGEEWKIFDETSQCCMSYSFTEIDSLYKSNTQLSSGTITSGAAVNIPWTSLGLAGKTLRQSAPFETRYVIVKHSVPAGGVYSYELLEVAFPGPNP